MPTFANVNGKRNLFFSLLNFVLGVGYGLIIPAFLIQSIGAGSFGLVQISLSLMMYLGLITGSLNEAINRLFTIELHEHKKSEANRTFNTAFFVYLVFFILLVPVICFVSFNVEKIFNVPIGIEDDAHYLFLFNLLSFFLVLFASVFLVPAFANNRVDLFQSTNVIRNLLRFVFILVFVGIISESLFFVGLSSLFASIIGLCVAVFIGVKLFPSLRLRVKYFDKAKIKPIFYFSFWTIINQLGILIFLYIDVILVNVFISEKAGGEYGALMQWNALFRNFSGVLGQLFAPMFMILYGRKNFDELKVLVVRSIKILGILLAIPVGIVFGFSKELLFVWLGDEFVHLSAGLKLMVSHLSLNYSLIILSSLALVYDRIKKVGLFTITMGILHIGLSVLLIKEAKIDFYGPLISAIILLGIKNLIFLPIYSARFINMRIGVFYKIIFQIIGLTFFSALCSSIISCLFCIDGWISLLLAMTMSVVIVIVIAYFVILNSSERKFLRKFIIKEK